MGKPIEIVREKQRLYALNAPFESRERLKALGCHWDADRRAWWIGAAKAAELAALVTELQTPREILADKAEDEGKPELAAELRAAPPAEDVSGKRVYASVTYKGRRYYDIGEMRSADGVVSRCRLATLDQGGPVFWADAPACELIRTYEPRQKWDGRRYSGKTITVYTTIGGLREFRDRQANPATARGECTECGEWGPRGQTCEECHEGTHV